MGELSQYALVSTAFATALVHTLIPDHWLPFVLIGRARNWSVGLTTAVSGVSALVHVVLSVALGLLALGLGRIASQGLGHRLGDVSHGLLIAFGVGYAAWSWNKGGHFHPGGARLHGASQAGCDGSEGDRNPEHLHYHADVDLIRGASDIRAWALALVVGINPCVLLLPLLVETADRGVRALAFVSIAYGVPTIGLMVGLSALGVRGALRLYPPRASRYMEAGSGLLIAVLGVGLWLAGH